MNYPAFERDFWRFFAPSCFMLLQSVELGDSALDVRPSSWPRAQFRTSCIVSQIDLILNPGEGIVWGTDPTPDAYDIEILRFGLAA
jgi:hypothetical protein